MKVQKIKDWVRSVTPGCGRYAIARSMDLEVGNFTITIHMVGMLIALLLIGGMFLFTVDKRDIIRGRHMEEYSMENASVSEESSKAEISWEFESAYQRVGSVLFELQNATEYAGEEITIVFDNGEGIHQEHPYVVPGMSGTEACGMHLGQLSGKGRNCRVSVLASLDVISDITRLNVYYEYYYIPFLVLLVISCLFLFLNLSFHVESEGMWGKCPLKWKRAD